MSLEQRLAEELLRDAAGLPPLSAGLRGQVLCAAQAAQRRRTRLRQTLAVGAAGCGLLAFSIWQGSWGLAEPGVASPAWAGESPATVPLARSELRLSAADDWGSVDAEIQYRDDVSRRFQAAHGTTTLEACLANE